MPLIELATQRVPGLKDYEPVCDGCGAKGPIARDIDIVRDAERILPPDWYMNLRVGMSLGSLSSILECAECRRERAGEQRGRARIERILHAWGVVNATEITDEIEQAIRQEMVTPDVLAVAGRGIPPPIQSRRVAENLLEAVFGRET